MCVYVGVCTGTLCVRKREIQFSSQLAKIMEAVELILTDWCDSARESSSHFGELCRAQKVSAHGTQAVDTHTRKYLDDVFIVCSP